MTNVSDSSPRIYVACLAAYNNGFLHGAWIDADQDADQMRDEIAAMLARSPVEDAEEYAIHDYEGFEGISISEYAGIDSLARMAAFIAEHGALGAGLLEQFSGDMDQAESTLEDCHHGQFASLADYMEELTTESVMIPEGLRHYVDWDAMARDAEMGGEHDISIPDQKRQGEAYCEQRGYQLVETYVEPGATATNDKRPEFQRMIEAGTSKPAPFDVVVVVHSFSRFFRDHFEMEFYVRKLAKNGVKLVSITQEMGDDPMHQMMRQIMALFDEYQSKENAKHVLRAMNENARQGFWNGARPPIGYRIVAAEQRGSKIKKKLEIDPLHADTVRLIYRLYLEGDGKSGAMGVKAIATYLNEHGFFTRDGGKWGLAQIHAILTRTTYIGEHRFNTRSHKDREKKPESEVAIMAVPPLIEREIFDAVQARLKSRDPLVTPARVSSGPTLLTGICFCAKCGGAMTLRTGKGSAGQTYRYYTCSTKARQGKTGCKGRTIPMDKLDHLVADHIGDRLLQPKRLETVLASVIDRRQERAERRREHLAELHRRITEADQRLGRLFDAIEAGMVDKDDAMAKERMASLKAIRDQAAADAERTQLALDSSGNQGVSPEMLKGFARKARERIRLDDGGYRRDHLRALAQRVEVADDEVRIMGSKSELLRTLVAASSVETAAFGVQSSVLKWRTRQDSNL